MQLPTFWPKPTHKETARYLDLVIEDLKKTHQPSSEEFEKELIKTTGIGVRQARTYRNSPTPNARLKGNSTVLPFVLEMQSKDLKRRWRIRGAWGITLVGVVGLAVWLATRPTKPETFGIRALNLESATTDKIINAKIQFPMPGTSKTLSVGPVKNLPFDRKDLRCNDILGSGMQTCKVSGDGTDTARPGVTLLIQGEVVTRVTVMTSQLDQVESIRKSLKGQIGTDLVTQDLTPKEFDLPDERVSVMIAPSQLPGFRPMISATVSLK